MIGTGLDLSLTGTGIARIEASDAFPDPPLVQTVRIGSEAAGQDVAARSRRLRELAQEIIVHCAGSDWVGVESPAYSSNTGSAHDRSGLWWLVIARLTAQGIPVFEVTSGTLKVFATGVGKGGKDKVLSETVRRYVDVVPNLSTNDEADALTVAAMGWLHYTGEALVPLPQTHTRALKAIHWPTR